MQYAAEYDTFGSNKTIIAQKGREMMATEKMYELAFRFKGAKLWQQLYDDEAFAVKLADGEIGYCSVMGRMGDHFALGLYVGEEGYKSYRLLLDADSEELDNAAVSEMMTSQSCLQCSFENKDMLSTGELEEVRQYAKAHNKKLGGSNAFPQFTKFRPGRYPWRYDSRLDEQRICDALSAAVALKRILLKTGKEELGLRSLQESVQKIPMLAYANGRWVIQYTRLPSAEIRYPEPVFANEVLTAHIQRKKKKGVWECGTIRFPGAVQEEGQKEEAPYFPLVLVCANLETGRVLQPVITDGEDAAETMNGFAQQLMEAAAAPKTIRCGDDRCFAILKDLCEKTGIRLVRTDVFELLDDALADLLEHVPEDEDDLNDEELEELYGMLLQMSDEELRQLPEDYTGVLLGLAEDGTLPHGLAGRIKKLFRGR